MALEGYEQIPELTVSLGTDWWQGLRQACFPGAVGYGTETSGGRGGQVIKVTNLNPSGAGSLHQALVNTSGARTIIFEVSGTIEQENGGDFDWAVNNGNVTVAGYTAPFPGIQLRGINISITAPNVVFQHLAVRAGDTDYGRTGNWGGVWHAIQILGTQVNVVIDHCTMMWGMDENFSVSSISSGIDDITVSNSIIAECLHNSKHSSGGAHSMNSLIRQRTRTISIIDTILHSSNDRHPLVQHSATGLFANNFTYNPGQFRWSPHIRGDGGGTPGPSFWSVIGNVGRSGPSTLDPVTMQLDGTLTDDSRFYIDDNDWEQAHRNENPAATEVGSPPIALPTGWSNRGSANVETWVKAHSGARAEQGRDAVDQRLINEINAGTGSIKNTVAQAGGYPTYAENTTTHTIPGNHASLGASGFYTVLEEQVLFPLLGAVEGKI